MWATNQLVAMGTNSDAKCVTYENERVIGPNENSIEWRSRNQNKYSKIPQMACKYLCIAVTSTQSERMFSAFGHLTSDRRSQLTSDNTNILLFLNMNG